MEPIITNALMTFGAGFVGATFSKAQGPGQALDDVMTLVGFNRLHEVAEKKRAKRDLNIQLYKDSIAQKIVTIPEEDLKDPPLAIVGPALEASKYYIEEEILREMFAKLISSSMDKSNESITHASYVEIIKQLSPLDAENLKYLYLNEGEDVICNLTINYSTGGYDTKFRNVYIGNPKIQDQSLIVPSLDNLQRLGLIEITTQEYKNNSSLYRPFEDTPEYKSVEEDIISQNSGLEILRNVEKTLPEFSGPVLEKGIIRLNFYGSNFCATCL